MSSEFGNNKILCDVSCLSNIVQLGHPVVTRPLKFYSREGKLVKFIQK